MVRTCFWVDYDQDGLPDIFTSNHVNPNRLYHNNGNGTFADMATSTNIAGPTDVFACSWADFDGDGDMDVFLSGHGVSGPTNALMRIDGVTNHYLKVKLIGVVSNKAAIGARLKLVAGTLFQYREVNGGTGSEEQSSIIQHFGLGTRTRWDSLVVSWPSGITDRLFNLRADTTLVIIEGMTEVDEKSKIKNQNGQIVRIYPNPTRREVRIKMIQDTRCRIQDEKIKIYDGTGKLVRSFTLSSMPYAFCLNPGVYFVMVDLDGETFIHKVTVIR